MNASPPARPEEGCAGDDAVAPQPDHHRVPGHFPGLRGRSSRLHDHGERRGVARRTAEEFYARLRELYTAEPTLYERGKFDKALYEQKLSENGLTPAMFEQLMRDVGAPATKPDPCSTSVADMKNIGGAHGGSLTLENRIPEPGCEALLRLPV